MANIRVAFHEDARPESRQIAEQSIATLVKRGESALAAARAAEAEVANLTNALNVPLAKLISSDPQATAAIEKLNKKSIIHAHSIRSLRNDAPLTATESVVRLPRGERLSPRTLVMRPPYNFSWSWHDQSGGAPFNQLIVPETGFIGLDARSGAIDGGFSGAVAAHVGFGIFVSTDHPTSRTGSATINSANFSYHLATAGVGGNATSEGGWECTALENGQLIASSGFQWWRKRISNGESAQDREGPFDFSVPNNTTGMTFAMQPGRQYTFNVGVWVFSDRSTGLGAAACQSLAQGYVTLMWVQ